MRPAANLPLNPYLPSWEYVPDAEPHVFGDRVYVYGSQDLFNGWAYCLGDYVCYSAPVTDLTDWRYEGVIYPRNADPANADGAMCLYAPDVTRGPDGRYYLYYVLDKLDYVSVAVCDSPAGRYEFYGNVHYPDGVLLGRRAGDMPQFDPGVITEGDDTYLYTGFAARELPERIGATAVKLAPDMLTVVAGPVLVAPSVHNSTGTGFAGHEFFEAPSIRKIGDTYYFVYSTIAQHELGYATSENPLGPFTYRGVIISNMDVGIDSYKPAELLAGVAGNNHGGIECINGHWYVFYHRHTNGNQFSRQTCFEPITINADGSIPQVEITSSNGQVLPGRGRFPAYIACNIIEPHGERADVFPLFDPTLPFITQDGRDGDELDGYVANIRDGNTIGFKYFDLVGPTRITLTHRGYANGYFEVRTELDGPILGTIEGIDNTNVWAPYSGVCDLPAGKHALYLTFRGQMMATIGEVILEPLQG